MSVVLEANSAQIVAEQFTEVHEDTLGFLAVKSAEDLALAPSYSRRIYGGPRIPYLRREQGIAEAREKINAIHPDHHDAMEVFFETSLPVKLQAAKENDVRAETWQQYFVVGERNVIMKALEWNVANMRRLQNDPEINQAIADKKEDYKARISSAMRQGWLPSGALQSVKMTDNVDTYIGDTFDTYFQDCSGFYVRGETRVVIGGERTNGNHKYGVLRNIESGSTLPHELAHATLGRFAERWINEAMTEHITTALLLGEYQVVHPDERTVFDPVYKAEREILHYLLTLGNEQIPLGMAIDAYVDNVNLRAPSEANENFYKRIDESWFKGQSMSKHFVRHIEDYIKQRTEMLMLDGKTREVVAVVKASEEAAELLRERKEDVIVATSKLWDLQVAGKVPISSSQ